jgi:hypothetical protein
MSDVNNEPQSVENENGDKKVDSDNDDEDLDALLDGKSICTRNTEILNLILYFQYKMHWKDLTNLFHHQNQSLRRSNLQKLLKLIWVGRKSS